MSPPEETILVVEDDGALAQGIGHNLRYEGYRVRLATDGRDGLRMALEHPPDLIVLDVMLPGLSGFDVLRRLRAEGVDSQVILLTAKDLEADKVTGLELGADDYMTKPFGLRELLARVNAALRRPRQARAAQANRVVSFGEITLLVATRQALRAQEPLKMTARELDLLLFLADHPERTFSRSQLLERVWGEEYEGTGRTVDNFIARLRKKIEPDPAHPTHLQTVHGLGYRFMPR